MMNPFTDNRPLLALALLAVYFAVNFGWRTLRQIQTTGSSGFQGISGRIGSVEWIGGVLFVVGLVLGVVAPVAAYFAASLLFAPSLWQSVTATAIAVVGITGTTWAQLAMGKSWRIGVNQNERTELIQNGPFALVRNPIFSFMILTSIGLTWLLPNWISLAATASVVIAIELQVRFVEEPYLRRVHGNSYDRYCEKAGRFLPMFGTRPQN